MHDYGHIDDETPSLAISLYKEYRGQGIGTNMMKEMLSLLKTHGYKRVSLSVQKANYAAKIYRKIGFDIVREHEEEWIMLWQDGLTLILLYKRIHNANQCGFDVFFSIGTVMIAKKGKQPDKRSVYVR